MKIFPVSLVMILSLLIISGCSGTGDKKKGSQSANDVNAVPDTGYTGIKQYFSGQYLVSEVTFDNGVREGIMKSYYQDGRLRQTFWYENGLREDSSRWFYQAGQIFRTTPYVRDTMHGVQIQYYRNGTVKAKLSYIKGLRTPFFEEYTQNGRLVTDYPELEVTTRDNYQANGSYRVSLQLSDKSTKVQFYRGEFINNVFDTSRYEEIKTIKGVGNLDLKKTESPKTDYVGVIAKILTSFGNNYLVYKKIELPYNDLN